MPGPTPAPTPTPSPTPLRFGGGALLLRANADGVVRSIVRIANTGDAPVDYRLREDLDWVSLRGGSGTLPGGRIAVVAVDATCPPAAGERSGTLTLDGPVPQSLTVNLLCAENVPGPEATVSLRLSDRPFGSWSGGAVDVTYRSRAARVVATARTDPEGRAALALPRESAALLADATTVAEFSRYGFEQVGVTCDFSDVTSLDPKARVLFGDDFTYETPDGPRPLVAGRAMTVVEHHFLVFSTRATVVEGPVACGDRTVDLEYDLRAGWNIVSFWPDRTDSPPLFVSLDPLTSFDLALDDGLHGRAVGEGRHRAPGPGPGAVTPR